MKLQGQLEILKAALEGKEIEIYNPMSESWRTRNLNLFPTFDFVTCKYRIKPEPKKEIKLHQYLLKNLTYNTYVCSIGFYPNLEECVKDYKNMNYIKVINKLQHTEITITED